MTAENGKSVPTADEAPRVFGKYRVVRLLGRGGMSEVFEVEDSSIGSRHALKAYSYGKDDPEVRRRFLAEGRLLARLSHPRIVKVTDIGEESGMPYFVMDLVLDPDGRNTTLADVPEGSADEDTVGGWFDDVREALSYIHSRGVVHRDLKLQNVMVGPDGHAVLADFGISRIFDPDGDGARGVDAVNTIVNLRDGKRPLMGSLGYMAPELEMGAQATPRSDWYALGVIVYKLLTGVWCDSRTDVASTLETYDPAWAEIIPLLLHSNPEGRECRAWSATKAALREKAEAESERRYLKEKRRGHVARHVARYAAALALVSALAAALVGFRLARVRARLADARDRLAVPTFSQIFRIPANIDKEGSDGAASMRPEFELSQVDAWYLTHGLFDGLASGAIGFDEAFEILKSQQRRIARGEEDELFGEEYDGVGSEDALRELYRVAVRRMGKAGRRINARKGRAEPAPAEPEPAPTEE